MIDAYRDAFREEAHEILVNLETALLELEAQPDNPDLVGTIFRYMHTIKGSGAMFGFDDIAFFTHEVETVFDQVRNGNVPVTKELIDLTLAARDQIRMMLDCAEMDSTVTGKVMNALKRLLSNPEKKHPPEKLLIKEEEEELLPSDPSECKPYRIRFIPSPEIFLSGVNPILLFNELRSMGKVTVTVNTDNILTLEDINCELCYTWWDILLITAASVESIKDVFIFVEDMSQLTVQLIEDEIEEHGTKRLGEILVERGDLDPRDLNDLLSKQNKIGELLVEAGLVSPHKVESALVEQKQVKEIQKERHQIEQQSSIKVPADKLDHLVNLVGEQVTAQARLSQLALSVKHPELTAIAEEIARLTADLRDNTLNIRMLPIGATFSRFRRLVRDLSRELRKEVEMTTEGEETELDKTVIDRLNDPLVHMIRNCIDHAIEPPDVRTAKGKPRQGTVHLAAVHSGDSVNISIMDDGAGLNKDAIFAKAVEKGLVCASSELTEKEIYALIFAPGFSTATTVSSVSGRGVGMDVVKRSIEDLRGAIDIKSERDVGTTITVRIPLTMAIIESLQVKIGPDHYMFPLALVDECMFLTKKEKETGLGQRILTVRDNFVPYVRLREEFGVNGFPPPMEQVVITTVNGERVGFVVDNIIGQHQTVIKSLGPAYTNVEGVSGATILGNGSVALILDIPRLYHTAGLRDQAA